MIKNRVFYRYHVAHKNHANRSIRPTGVTLKIKLMPEEKKILFSAAVSNTREQFVRSEGRSQAELAWMDGKIWEVTYPHWYKGDSVVDIIHCALIGYTNLAQIVKRPEDTQDFKCQRYEKLLAKRLAYPKYSG